MGTSPLAVLGTCGSAPSYAVYNYLAKQFPSSELVCEQPQPRKEFLGKRIKKLGLFRVAGQVALQGTIFPLLKTRSSRRIRQIQQELDLEATQRDGHRVTSVNSEEAIAIVKRINPSCIVLAGTRIVSKNFLASFECPVINIHAGITPLYRGVHGAYWALAEGRRELCGVTVHRVDAGIDTGGILEQAIIEPGLRDNISTYPWLQLGAGLKILARLLPDIIGGTAVTKKPLTEISQLRTHPTIWEYCWNRMRHSVK